MRIPSWARAVTLVAVLGDHAAARMRPAGAPVTSVPVVGTWGGLPVPAPLAPPLQALRGLDVSVSQLWRLSLARPADFQVLVNAVRVEARAPERPLDRTQARQGLVESLRREPAVMARLIDWAARDFAEHPQPQGLSTLFDGAPRETIDALAGGDAKALAGMTTQLRLAGDFAAIAGKAPRFLRKDGRRHLVRMAAARAAGVSRSRVGADFPEHRWATSARGVSRLFDQPLHRYSARLDIPADGAVLGDPAFLKRQVKLFPAEFQAMPIRFFKEGAPRGGIPADANLFSMTLPEAEIARSFGTGFEKLSFGHLENSFGYIRFYVRGDDVVVTEIQSEIYGGLQTDDQRARYQHWSRVLLLGFERYIYDSYFSQRDCGSCRILIAGEDYQKRRWENEDAGIGAGLARMLYRDLPKIMGYAPEKGIAHGFEWPEHLEGPRRKEILAIQEGWSLPVAAVADDQGPLRGEFRRRLESRSANRFDEAIAELAPAFEHVRGRERTPQPPRTRRGTTGEGGLFESAPSLRVSLAEIPGMTTELIATYRNLLASLPESVHGILSTAWTWISRGSGDSGNIRAPGTAAGPTGAVPVQGTHLEGMDRHPHLMTAGAVIGIKGGGARADRTAGYENYALQYPGAGMRIPIYRTLKNGKPPQMQSHRYWGGLSREEGEIEFLNHLALHKLLYAVDGGPAAANIPYDLGVIERFPVWTPAGTQWVSARAYRKRYLKGGAPELATLRSIGPSGLRIVQAVQSIFDDLPRDEHQRAVQRTVTELYAAFGELPVFPQTPLAAGPDGKATQAQVLEYLREIYRINQDKAERMMERLESRSLKTMAAVHGAGGHLGGVSIMFQMLENNGAALIEAYDPPLGAPNGGAPALRNMSVTGEFRDLDGNVYLPWLDRPDLLPQRRSREELNLKYMQENDLLYWETSISWMRNLLMGRTLPADGILIEMPFGDPASGIIVAPKGYDYETELARRLLVRNAAGVWKLVEPKHAELYDRLFQTAASLPK